MYTSLRYFNTVVLESIDYRKSFFLKKCLGNVALPFLEKLGPPRPAPSLKPRGEIEVCRVTGKKGLEGGGSL